MRPGFINSFVSSPSPPAELTFGAFTGSAINTLEFNSGAFRWRALYYRGIALDGTATVIAGTDVIPSTDLPYLFMAGRGGTGASGAAGGGAGGGGGGSVFLGRLTSASAPSGVTLRLAVAPGATPTVCVASTSTASLGVEGGQGGSGSANALAAGAGTASTVSAGIDGSTLTAYGASGGGAGNSGTPGAGGTWTNGIGSGTVIAGKAGGTNGAGGGGSSGGSALFVGNSTATQTGANGKAGVLTSAFSLQALTDFLTAIGAPAQFGVGGAGGGGFGPAGVGVLLANGGATFQRGFVGDLGEGSGGCGLSGDPLVASGDGLVALFWPIGVAVDIGGLATGGTVTDVVDGGFTWRTHVLTASTNFVVTQAIKSSEWLLVGGGGGGGSSQGTGNWGSGAGGGGGRIRVGSGGGVDVGTYPVVVGTGGAGGLPNTSAGTAGLASTLWDGASAIGGQPGGLYSEPGGFGSFPGGASGGSPSFGGGGGGGAGAAGVNGVGAVGGGAGGAGTASSIATGAAVNYGGGGGVYTAFTPGAGTDGGGAGGAAGANVNGVAGTDGLGGGGGGASTSSGTKVGATSVGGKGGDGLVVIRYPIA